MTTQSNPTLTNLENIFHSLVWQPIVSAGLVSFFAGVPALAIWPIQPLITDFVNWFSGWIFSQLVLFLDVAAIKLQNEAYQNAYDAASIKLLVIAHDKGINSDEFIKAREEAKVALSKFVSYI